jgi:hypothetical protein
MLWKMLIHVHTSFTLYGSQVGSKGEEVADLKNEKEESDTDRTLSRSWPDAGLASSQVLAAVHTRPRVRASHQALPGLWLARPAIFTETWTLRIWYAEPASDDRWHTLMSPWLTRADKKRVDRTLGRVKSALTWHVRSVFSCGEPSLETNEL